MKTKTEYLDLRRRYQPEQLRLIVVAESPPHSGLYFYDPTGRTSEPLFSAIMKQLDVSSSQKETGLREFQRRGWVLVDATYEPVNKHNNPERDAILKRDYPQLRDDLMNLTPDRSVPVAVIKANVCDVVKPFLIRDGFNVINGDIDPPFPGSGNQNKFLERFKTILQRAAIS